MYPQELSNGTTCRPALTQHSLVTTMRRVSISPTLLSSFVVTHLEPQSNNHHVPVRHHLFQLISYSKPLVAATQSHLSHLRVKFDSRCADPGVRTRKIPVPVRYAADYLYDDMSRLQSSTNVPTWGRSWCRRYTAVLSSTCFTSSRTIRSGMGRLVPRAFPPAQLDNL